MGRDRFNGATTRGPWMAVTLPTNGSGFGKLQRGHDPRAVDGIDLNVLRAMRNQLQRGHDPRAVDGPSARPIGMSSVGCFNGATTRGPWMGPSAESVLPSEYPRFNGATTRGPWMGDSPRTDAGARHPASTGPRPEGRGWWIRCESVTSAAFDASTGPRPEGRGWPTTKREPLTITFVLQRGHDPRAVDGRRVSAARA